MKKEARRRTADPGADEPRLYPYQRRWVEDESRFKIACKARQVGFTFAAAWRVVDMRLQKPGLTLWLSASERQAIEAMEYVRRFCRELRVVVQFEDEFIEGMQLKRREVRLPNGSRVIGLPANPDTVRGFAGDIVLDEFAFHRDAEAIWRAAFATATRGYQIEIISTPNGARGKYYELARAAGLVDYTPPLVNEVRGETRQGFPRSPSEVAADATSLTAGLKPRPAKTGAERPATKPAASSPLPAPMHDARGSMHGIWSPHWVSLPHARAEGFVVDVESLRAAISDEDAWQQEYCCRFLTDAAHFIPPEMVVAAEHPAATTSLLLPAIRHQRSAISAERETALAGNCFLGVDIGRRRDLTVLWLIEAERPDAPAEARRYVTRSVQALDRRPFAEQRRAIDNMMAVRSSFDSSEGHGGSCPERRRGSRAEKDEPSGATLERARGNPAWVAPASFSYLIRRCALDASGLGLMLAEELQSRWGARVEPVTFTAAVKEDLAVRVKRMLEERRLLLPYDPVIRASLGAVKRYVTPAGNVRFDADRTDAGHADHFWALALALAAADDSGPATDFISTHSARAFAQSNAY